MGLVQQSEDTSDVFAIVNISGKLLIYFSIVSYFTGWIYTNEYLSHFGLYVSNLDISFHHVFVYSYAPLLEAIYSPNYKDWIRLLVLLSSFAGCVYVYRWNTFAGNCTAVAYFLLILYLAFEIALEKGQIHASYVLNGGGKVIEFVFVPQIQSSIGNSATLALLKANQNGALRLVWRTETDTHAVDVLDNQVPKHTYRIPVDLFLFSHVQGNTPK